MFHISRAKWTGNEGAPSWLTKSIQIPKQDFAWSNQAPVSSGNDMGLQCVVLNTSDQ